MCVRKMRYFLVPILFSTTVLLVGSVSLAEEMTRSDWSITIGLGAFNGSDYEGSDDTETVASPIFEIVWNDWVFLNQDALGINFYKNESLILNAIVSEGDERKESLHANLEGLGNINASTTLTLGAEFEMGLFLSHASLIKHGGGTNGIQAVIGLETVLPLRMLTGKLDMASMDSMGDTVDPTLIGPLIIASLIADWADDDYISAFFSVDAEQSARSGLPQYAAEAGFKSVSLEISVLHFLNTSWTAQGLAGYSKFFGDVQDSPVVKDDDHVYFGGFINYHF